MKIKKIETIRTKNLVRQIKGSFFYKVIAMILSFLIIRVLINFVGEVRFGVWVTMFAILNWIVFFDVGLGNGLKNKLNIALSKNNREEASALISTGYISVAIISVVAFVLLFVVSFFVKWQVIFNTDISEYELRYSVIVIAFFVFFNFILSLIKQVYNSIQKTSMVVFQQMLSNLCAFSLIFACSYLYKGNLIVLAFLYGLSLLFASFLMNIKFFKDNSDIVPKFNKFNFFKIKEILGLGIQFFIIQIAVLILFTSDKIILTQLFGPVAVSEYEVVYKLFTGITILFSLYSGPLWPAYTEAYVKNDLTWIKDIIKRSNLIVIFLSFVALILILFAQDIIYIWINRDFTVDNNLIWIMAFFVILKVWSDNYAIFLNGLGIIKVQMTVAIIQSIINIPLSIYLGMKIGIGGVILATVISLSISGVVLPLQSFFVLRGKNEFVG